MRDSLRNCLNFKPEMALRSSIQWYISAEVTCRLNAVFYKAFSSEYKAVKLVNDGGKRTLYKYQFLLCLLKYCRQYKKQERVYPYKTNQFSRSRSVWRLFHSQESFMITQAVLGISTGQLHWLQSQVGTNGGTAYLGVLNHSYRKRFE